MICSIVVASLLFYNLFLFFTPIQTLPSHHRSVNSLLILNTFFFGVKVHLAQYTDAKYRRWAAAAAAAGFSRRRVCNKTSCHLSLRRERFYKRCRLGLERAREELSEGCLSRGDLDINMWKKLRRFLSSAPSIQRFSEPRQQCVAECLRKSVFFFFFFPSCCFTAPTSFTSTFEVTQRGRGGRPCECERAVFVSALQSSRTWRLTPNAGPHAALPRLAWRSRHWLFTIRETCQRLSLLGAFVFICSQVSGRSTALPLRNN